jgi:uncharacterized protein with gpF-like domain
VEEELLYNALKQIAEFKNDNLREQFPDNVIISILQDIAKNAITSYEK